MRRVDEPIRGHIWVAGIALTVLLSLLLLRPQSAVADFEPIQLQSVGALEQFEAAGESAISEDGRYLAFEGTLAGAKGIYRKDLQTGQLQLVAGGSIYAKTGAIDASAPSISADGGYVSFTSAVALVKAASAGENVYVRDMEAPAPAGGGACDEEEELRENGKRCAYELASALSGGEEGIAYGAEGGVSGAVASGRVALSASGREIAFVIDSNSDLQSHDAAELTTPPLQVAVRYLAPRDETVLVSVQREPASGQMTDTPVAGGAVTPSAQHGIEGAPRLPGAALSGDGSTVAWLGAHIPEQAPTLEGERQLIEAEDEKAIDDETYDEPLWRRIGDGPGAPTRRMVGGGDPLAPGCPPDGTIETGACQGPYLDLDSEHWEGQQNDYGWLGLTADADGTPQLSYDGQTVALIGDPDGTSNVYVVNMSETLDRQQAVRQLTREVPVANLEIPGSKQEYVSGDGEIYEASISPDGTRIAFTTQRQLFPLAPPNFTEIPPAELGIVELYQIDLVNQSLVRVTHGPDDGPSLEGSTATITTAGAADPSYSADGLTLAFADTASNLVAGDSNGASDVFTVFDLELPEREGPVQIGPAATDQEQVHAQWRLSVVPVVHRNGSLTLQVDVPGAGELSASVRATVPTIAHAARGRRASATGASAKRGATHTGRVELRKATIASARMGATLACLLELPLRVVAPYTKLLATKAGIYATVRVTFKGAGGPTLSQTVTVSLRRSAKPKPKPKTRPHRATRGRRVGGGASHGVERGKRA